MVLAYQYVERAEDGAVGDVDLREATGGLATALHAEEGVGFVAFVVGAGGRHVEDLAAPLVVREEVADGDGTAFLGPDGLGARAAGRAV